MSLKRFVERKIELAIDQLEEANHEILNENFESANELYDWLEVSDKLHGFVQMMNDVFGDVNI